MGPPERFTPEQVSAEMQRTGFMLVKTNDFLPNQFFVVHRQE